MNFKIKKMEDEENYNEMPPNEGQEDMPPQEGEMPEEEKFFKDFTNQDIDNKDPSLGKDLIKIYEEEVPFEIRHEDEDVSNNGTFESLLCKILTSEEMNNQSPSTKIEIGCDRDLFFYYSCDVTSELFDRIKKTQKLTCNFNSFSDLLIKHLDNCISDTKKYLAVFNMQKDGKAKMELFENLEHKFGELISLDFKPVPDDIIRQQISYRYSSMRATDDIIQNRIDIINGVLKEVDPQLIYEVKKDISKVKVESFIRDKPLIQKP